MRVNIKHFCDFKQKLSEWEICIGMDIIIKYPRWMVNYIDNNGCLWLWESMGQYRRWENKVK